MSRIRWTEQASNELDAAFACIRRDSPANGQAFVIRLIAAIDQLYQFPESGRIVSEFARRTRELTRARCRVVYPLHSVLIEIITIHHSARPLPPTQP